MATYINGFGGNVSFGSFTFSVVEWTLKTNNSLIDVTNTGSSNWGQYIGGINSGQVSIKAFWDTSAIYTGASANLIPGQSGSCTLLIGSSGKSVVASMVIMTADFVNSPAAGVQYNIEAMITSAPTFPT